MFTSLLLLPLSKSEALFPFFESLAKNLVTGLDLAPHS